MDAKSADRRLCLLHFIVDTINKKMPELANFNSELLFIEKAATGMIHNSIYLQTDYNQVNIFQCSVIGERDDGCSGAQ